MPPVRDHCAALQRGRAGCMAGLYKDILVFLSAGDGAPARLVLPAVPEKVLLSAVVPVLLIPDLWRPEKLGRRMVVAWNASRKATRALHDALPLLAAAEAVTLFAYDARQTVMREEMDLLIGHLAEHGVSARPFICSRRLEHLFGGVSEDRSTTSQCRS
jgi:hypothetical protein